MTAIIPIELIDPHPSNPRRDLGNLDELADSIRAQGVRQNLLVVQVHSLTKHDWRAHTPLLLGLYETLTGLGYIPSDVEQTWIETAATKRAAVLEEQR